MIILVLDGSNTTIARERYVYASSVSSNEMLIPGSNTLERVTEILEETNTTEPTYRIGRIEALRQTPVSRMLLEERRPGSRGSVRSMDPTA